MILDIKSNRRDDFDPSNFEQDCLLVFTRLYIYWSFERGGVRGGRARFPRGEICRKREGNSVPRTEGCACIAEHDQQLTVAGPHSPRRHVQRKDGTIAELKRRRHKSRLGWID